MYLSRDKEIAIKESLPPPELLGEMMKNDEGIMLNFGVCMKALNGCGKYQKNSRRYKMKQQAIKNQFIDSYLAKMMKKSQIVVNVKNNLVLDHFKNKKEKIDFDELMKELDEILNTPIDSSDPSCNCRNEGFGFCFCRI